MQEDDAALRGRGRDSVWLLRHCAHNPTSHTAGPVGFDVLNRGRAVTFWTPHRSNLEIL